MDVNSSWLQDLNKMHQHLQTQINSAKTLDDLMPFAATLLDLHTFKSTLLSLLKQQYENEAISNDYSANKIRSLFIETNQMNGIPSDDVQSNIISYLSNQDLAAIPIVSKHFNKIIHEYSQIYNDNQYKLSIYDDIDENDVSDAIGWNINLNHEDKYIKVVSYSDNEHDGMNIMNKLPKIFKQIKIWEVCTSTQRALDIVCKNSNNIYSLTVDKHSCFDMEQKQNVTNKLSASSFSNCKILKVGFYIDCIHTNFVNLEYLEIYSSLKAIIEAIKYIPTSLYALKFHVILEKKAWRKKYNVDKTVIKIPVNIQWLSMNYIGYDGIQFDLSECNKLMAMTIPENIINNIIWPKQYIVPYSKIVAKGWDDLWYNLEQKSFPIRIVLCRGFDSNLKTLDEIQQILNSLNEYEKLHDTKGRCIALKQPEDTYNDCVFRRIMEMIVIDEAERNNNILKIEKLVKLDDDRCYWIKSMFIEEIE